MESYNADAIKVLDDVSHIRLRKGMYIGEGIDPSQLISEIIDNAIDEVQAGFSDKLEVFVDTTNNIYTVRDYGRGIPHGSKKLDNGEEKEILEVLATKANSGGKFDNRMYSVSSGLNGLGITVTNALSNYLELTSYRDGKFVKIHSEQGRNNILTKGSTSEKNGTLAVFQPDKTMFKTAKIPMTFIIERCRVASALGIKADLYIDDKSINTDATMFDLISEDEDAKISNYADVPVMEVTNKAKEKMKVALRYTSDTHDRYFGFTNLLINRMGGTHVQQLSKTISDAWIEFLDQHKNIKPAVELKRSDYLVGLRAVCAVFIAKPDFSSQTKEKLVVDKNYLNELMAQYKTNFIYQLESNIVLANQLVKRFEEYRQAQNALLSRKEISSIIKVNDDDENNIRRRSVVSKLVECTSRKRHGSELFIVEGDSARGPYLYVRDKETQAVLPIRGKILNTTGKTVKDAIRNNEICDIANAIGCGIGDACDANKSRYDRIIISADADEDGKHINCLVLALFVNMFPDLVKAGRVFLSTPPLFYWHESKNKFGSCQDVHEIPSTVKNAQRCKGLGEMGNDAVSWFLVNKDTRNLIQVEYPADINNFNKILGTSEGRSDLLKDLGVIVTYD